MRAALRLGEWISRDDIAIADLQLHIITALIQADNAAHQSHRVANESTAAVTRFLRTTQPLSLVPADDGIAKLVDKVVA